MYDFQNTVLLSAKPTKGILILRYVTMVIAALGVFFCFWVNPFLFWMPAILLIMLWWWVWFHTNIEYEYAYFDGDLDFDKIRDKRRRKSVLSVNMAQVERIAPVGDQSLHSAHQDPRVKFMDLSSRKEGRKCYELIWKEAGQTVCLRFEPDEKFLNSICVKYGHKVIK